MVQELNSTQDFSSFIQEGYSLVDFYATWCGPCKMLSPLLELVSNELEDKIKFAKVDVDKLEIEANRLRIQVVPTVVVFKEGVEVSRFSGFREKEGILSFIQESLSNKQ